MSFFKRYSDIKRGGIIFCGNTLGLSKKSDACEAGEIGSIGAFTSLNLNLSVPTFPAGTTLNYLQNGSSTVLNLPSNSTVLHAEIIWGGLYKSSTSSIENVIDNNITLTAPSGQFTIAPDSTTSQNHIIKLTSASVGFYSRSQNITEYVITNPNGTYSVEGVPALIDPIEAETESTNHAGWTLVVVYENPSMPLRNLTFWSGGAVVSSAAGHTDVVLNGFLTPEALPVTGKLFVSAAEGDAVHSGDQLLFGSTIQNLAVLSGPNNPQNNFFASQINNENGVLDTTGTFGDRNADAFLNLNTSACRQGWDITAIDLSDNLSTNQNQAVIRFKTNGDTYVTNALAILIDSQGADIVASKYANKTYAEVGQTIIYNFEISNNGVIDANDVELYDELPINVEIVPGSIKINGTVAPDDLPIKIGLIPANQSVLVELSAIVVSLLDDNSIKNTATVNYTFEPFVDYSVSSSTITNEIIVDVIDKKINVLKSVNTNFAAIGQNLTYTSTISNLGNITANNLIFVDNIPLRTKFVEGSVSVNGISQPSYNPQEGFEIGNLAPTKSVIITFDVVVQQGENMIITNQSNCNCNFILPDGEIEKQSVFSNFVETEVLSDVFSKIKSSSKAYLLEGETATQTVTLFNGSSTEITNIFFKDIMTEGADYVEGSVKIDGISYPTYSLIDGFDVGNIAQKQTITIEYQIIANNPLTSTPVINYANIQYKVNDMQFSENTNEVEIEIVSNKMNVQKSVNKTSAINGDILHYTNTITNNGSLKKTNVIFVDNIPTGTTFVSGSVKINGIPQLDYNPNIGFTLPNMSAGDVVIVEFDVKVNI
jgi:uncharacterized repeat protein (TIGR01451 family)